MNHVHRLVFNTSLGLVQVASELTSARGQRGGRSRQQGALSGHATGALSGHARHAIGLASLLLCSAHAMAGALPTGGTVSYGSGAISAGANTVTVDQASSKLAINWQSFSVGAGNAVVFKQPSASAIALNRVVGNEASVIAGSLSANGKVFLLNSNGILFKQGSSVNVGGLVASSLNLSDDDFAAGHYRFTQPSSGAGSVINMGTITATDGGYVALLGNSVSNQGVIVATKGTVVLGAGDKITLNFNGDSLLSVTIDEGALKALVDNKGAIYADGGKVILTAKAAEDLLDSQVNNSGLIQARTLGELKGEITLNAEGGTTTVGGTLDASAPTAGDGGFIDTSGTHVKVLDTAHITTASATGQTGTWLIDPDGFTIGTGGDISATLLSTLLNTNNISLASTQGSGSDGDINVNSAVSWNAPTTLTLTATNDINVNAPITAQYTAYDSASPTVKAGLVLTAGHDIDINNAITLNNAALTMTYGGDYKIRTKASYSGAVVDSSGNAVAATNTSGGTYGSITFTGGLNSGDALSIHGNSYTLIYSMSQLDGLDGYNAATSTGTATALTDHYALAGNLDASGTTYTSGLLGESESTAFTGTLTGLGHTISNLTISSTGDYTGLIGYASGATLRDIGLVDVSISGHDYTGALVSELTGGTLYDVYSTGTVTGGGGVGGLAGVLWSSTLSYAYSDADVTGTGGSVGGLVGYVNTVTASHVDATGDVTCGGGSGGLFGTMLDGSLSYAYATGTVTGLSTDKAFGGLIGWLALLRTSSSSTLYPVSYAFATGDVSGGWDVGGLIGYVEGGKSSNSYVIDNVYATGDVTATTTSTVQTGDGTGGLIGYIGIAGSLTISNAYATGDVTVVDGYGGDDGNAGGLVGEFHVTKNATITDSYATGDVYSANGSHVGGLVGGMGGGKTATISGSYATGDVTGYDSVGGLVGSMGAGTSSSITSSYATGQATATSATGYAGGIAGDARSTNIGSDVYYNSDTNAIGQAYTRDATGTDNSTGLSSTQLSDIGYYLNGTISQVLADRAAQAAAAAKAIADAKAQAEALTARVQAAAQTGASTATAQQSSTAPQAATTASVTPAPASTVSHIVYADEENFSANVQRIEVDGQSFELGKDDNKKGGRMPNTNP